MKKIQRRWIYAFLSIVLICICGLIFRKPQTVYAETINAKRIADIKTGDLLFMGKNAEGYTGLPCWRVLEKDSDGSVLLLSEYLWKGDGTEAGELIHFNTDETKGNLWTKSEAKQWCADFENAVLADVAGLKIKETTKSDAFFQSPDIVTIQYSKQENLLNKDKVFFLSAEEVAKYMPEKNQRIAYLHDGKNAGKAESWWLRSPRENSNVCAGRVFSYGDLGKNFVYEISAARPAFWADLSSIKSITGTENKGRQIWFIDGAEDPHSYAEPEYYWSDDQKTCTAVTSCVICGKEITENVVGVSEIIKKATEKTEGVCSLTATFTNKIFQTQVKHIPLAKQPEKPTSKPEKKIVSGAKYTVAGSVYKVLSPKAKTVSVVKAKNVKSYIISSTVKIESKIFKVVQVEANSLKAAKIDNVTVGKNVKTLKKNAFTGSKVIKVVLKTKNLKKSQIKGCMSGSKVKKVYVKVGTKAQNKKVLKSYKKFFRKSVIGRKVKIV